MVYMEISMKIYIKGKDPLKRFANLKKLAEKHYRGNMSEMVNALLDKTFGLDPDTGESKSKD